MPIQAWIASACLVAATLTVGLLPAMSTASILVQDQFTYPDGGFLPRAGWQAHSGGGSRPIQVFSGAIRLEQAAGSGEDVNKRWFVPQLPNDTTYASFNLRVPVGDTLRTDDYFAHFRPAPPDSIAYVTRVYAGPPSDSTTFTLGVSAGAVPTQGVIRDWPTRLLRGRTYRVVVAYDGTNGASTLWVDPADANSDTIYTGASAVVTGKPLESYAFRQSSPASTNCFEFIHDFRVGTEFNEVIDPLAKVPSASPWGMALLGLSLVLAGAVQVLRRRGMAGSLGAPRG